MHRFYFFRIWAQLGLTFGAQCGFDLCEITGEFAAEALGFSCFGMGETYTGGMQCLAFAAMGRTVPGFCCSFVVRMVVAVAEERHAGAGSMDAQLMLEHASQSQS